MILNLLLLTGTIIGAGIFSLPFVFQKLQWYYLPILLLLTLISIYLSFIYLTIIKKRGVKDQLPGYIRSSLGKNWGILTSFLLLFFTGGALLAYLILGGRFINDPLLFYIIMAAIFLLKPGIVEKWSDFLTVLLIASLMILILLNLKERPVYKPRLTTFSLLEGYGVILFSLTGFSILPELDFKDKSIYISIALSYFLVFLLYLFFGLFISPDHSFFLSVIGFLAVSTSYLPLSLVFEDTLNQDLLVPKIPAKLITLLLPAGLYIFGFHNFLTVVSFTGSVFLGSLAMVIIFVYSRIKSKRSFYEDVLLIISFIIFVLGLAGQIIAEFL